MNDPYTYPESDVLINKANLKTKEKLDEFENRMTNLAPIAIFKSNMVIKNVVDIYKIHKQLFEHVYDGQVFQEH